MVLDTLLIIGLIAVFAVVLPMFIEWADRRRVVRMIQQRSETIIRLERNWPTVRGFFGRGTTFWRVRYRNINGEQRIAYCLASGLRCKVYRDEAFSQATGLGAFLPKVEHPKE